MKKKNLIATIILLVISIGLLTGCNKQVLDFNYTFNKAIIKDVGTIEIKSWNDYKQSDMIQVTGTDGTVYLTHSSNVILLGK